LPNLGGVPAADRGALERKYLKARLLLRTEVSKRVIKKEEIKRGIRTSSAVLRLKRTPNSKRAGSKHRVGKKGKVKPP